MRKLKATPALVPVVNRRDPRALRSVPRGWRSCAREVPVDPEAAGLIGRSGTHVRFRQDGLRTRRQNLHLSFPTDSERARVIEACNHELNGRQLAVEYAGANGIDKCLADFRTIPIRRP
jgi:hypothetical protein